jgi:hypothetical protein
MSSLVIDWELAAGCRQALIAPVPTVNSSLGSPSTGADTLYYRGSIVAPMPLPIAPVCVTPAADSVLSCVHCTHRDMAASAATDIGTAAGTAAKFCAVTPPSTGALLLDERGSQGEPSTPATHGATSSRAAAPTSTGATLLNERGSQGEPLVSGLPPSLPHAGTASFTAKNTHSLSACVGALPTDPVSRPVKGLPDNPPNTIVAGEKDAGVPAVPAQVSFSLQARDIVISLGNTGPPPPPALDYRQSQGGFLGTIFGPLFGLLWPKYPPPSSPLVYV